MKKLKPAQEKKRAVKRPQPSSDLISPEQALQFLEDSRVLYSSMDEPTRLISIRIPENILRLLKTRAASEGKRYQSLMIEMIRKSLKP